MTKTGLILAMQDDATSQRGRFNIVRKLSCKTAILVDYCSINVTVINILANRYFFTYECKLLSLRGHVNDVRDHRLLLDNTMKTDACSAYVAGC